MRLFKLESKQFHAAPPGGGSPRCDAKPQKPQKEEDVSNQSFCYETDCLVELFFFQLKNAKSPLNISALLT